jgi:hypothetical protein
MAKPAEWNFAEEDIPDTQPFPAHTIAIIIQIQLIDLISELLFVFSERHLQHPNVNARKPISSLISV